MIPIKFEEYIYESLQGTLLDPHPEVESLFNTGMPCEKNYAKMLEAYQRICSRLNKCDEDDDIEIIINTLLSIQKEVALYMYYYGAKFKDHTPTPIELQQEK